MGRTTPPRPLDISRDFPELREHTAVATRLHPRPGSPTAADSSIGGPPRWPADEPWPVCTDTDHYVDRLLTPDTVRRMREIYRAARARAAATGERYRLTDAERAVLPGVGYSEPYDLARRPVALVPVAQVYRRDVPDWPGPADSDLLQVLWCPLDHPGLGYHPRVRVCWRRAADVTSPLDAVPEPAVVHDDYLPTPCLVHPERVREYQHRDLLPSGLDTRIRNWESRTGNDYRGDLSVAPGWKVGGFASWSLAEPYPVDCADCGSPMTLLLTASSCEWDGPHSSWRPAGEPDASSTNPTDVLLGRGYALSIFGCPRSFEHPPVTAMQ